MSEWSTRAVQFAGSRIEIEDNGGRARELVDFLYGHMRANVEGAVQARFRVESEGASGGLSVRRGDVVCYSGDSPADAARALQEAASFALAAGSGGGLLLHAASVSLGERVLLLAGPSGSGKTMLTASLIARGFRYLTDELSFLPDGSSAVIAFPRPLNIKTSGRAVLSDAAHDLERWSSLSSSVAMLLHPPAARSEPDPGVGSLGAVVFPRFQHNAQTELRRLSPAQCGMRLMSCLLNARNLPAHGFPAVAEVARCTVAYGLVYGEADRAAARLEDLAELRGVR
jgi:hypothetical protein